MASEGKESFPELDASDEAMATLAALQAAGPGAMGKVYVAMLEGAGDLGNEVIQFVADRIAEDVKIQHEIMECRNPADLVRIQQRFLQTAFDQYTAETGKLVKMSNDLIHAALKTATG
ncbi:phasin family protein [Defluviimonas sp. SAOS-178_SWC]|uniref:phasin family protein n=1 Tax=Defluviimonas sp. SAOS-178_SWC TaxID=3121287 RepID=UPI003221BE81